ncbi:MAG: ribokinase, partial [Chloroflexi bacterium]|nr:ribokinase [Chloroflexota bacterium]
YTIGGTATYAALTAQRLGLSVAVLTSAPPELELSSALPQIALHIVPSDVATTFENIYEGQKRRQFVHGIASPLRATHLPGVWKQAPIVLLCPLVRELDLDWIGIFPKAIVGVTPQGWMRQWDKQGLVTARAWTEAPQILPNVEVLVYSEEDVACDEAVIRQYAELAKIAVVTRGWRGATVFYNGIARDFPAFRAKEVDPTGAGDVFAAAFLVRLKETGDPYQAAPFANSAASFSIEGLGTTTIPTREQVEERLRFGKLYK